MGGAFSKHRFQIWNSNQHPYKHSTSEFSYSNGVVPGVSSVTDVLDYILAVLYPLSQASIPTKADLPVTATFVATIGSPAVIALTGNKYYTGDQVKLTTTGTLPAGLSVSNVYYLKETTTNTFQVFSDKNLLVPVAISTTGSGVHSVVNLPNSYRVVLDDGDGKAAAYRYEKREGDVAYIWYKVGDLDWGQDSVLTAFENITQDLYIYKQGKDDRDATGAVLTGDQAGQHVYGGASANTNLILHANSGDGTGAQTGAIEVADPILPLVNTLSLGSLTKKFVDLFLSGNIKVSTMTITGGSITDTTGAISFDNENLTTTGNVTGNTVGGTTVTAGNLSLSASQITSSATDISFGSNKIKTTGDVEGLNLIAKNGVKTTTISNGTTDTTLTSSQGSFDLQNANLKGINALTSTSAAAGSITVDNLTLDVNIISSTTDINVSPAVGSKVKLNKSTDVTGALAATGAVSGLTVSDGHTTLDGSKITSTTGFVDVDSSKVLRAGNIEGSDVKATTLTAGLVSENVADIVDFPFTGASEGNTIFYQSGHWVAGAPSPGVTDHGALTGLAYDDHTQYALLAGRTGGQNIVGGTAAADVLTLKSNAAAAKEIKTKDTVAPFTDATYSGGWTGLDLGTASLNFKDIYTKGEHKGLRLENVATLPAANVVNIGRTVFLTSDNKIYYDTGGAWVAIPLTAGTASPLTTKGDIYVFSTTNARLPIGTDGQVLVADSTQTTGLNWTNGVSEFISSSLSLTAGGSISIQTTYKLQTWLVAGTSAVSLSTTPFGATAPVDGAVIVLIGNDDTNTVNVVANDASKGVLGYDYTLARGQTITYKYNTTLDRYVIVGTSN